MYLQKSKQHIIWSRASKLMETGGGGRPTDWKWAGTMNSIWAAKRFVAHASHLSPIPNFCRLTIYCSIKQAVLPLLPRIRIWKANQWRTSMGGPHVLKMGRVWSLALPQIRKGNVSITGVHYSKYCSLLLPMSDPFALGSGSFPSGIRDELIGYCWPKTTKLRSSSIKQQSQCPKRKKKLTD